MDFILSLAHFCESHGPNFTLCTQVLPISCLNCHLPPTTSSSGLGDVKTPPTPEDNSQGGGYSQRRVQGLQPEAGRTGSTNKHRHAQTQAHSSTHSSDTSSTFSTPIDTPQHSPPKGERGHFGDGPSNYTTEPYKHPNGIGASEHDCTACNFSVPKSLTVQIPSGAPGSPTKSGRSSNGCPVLRTREAIIACDGHHESSPDGSDSEAHRNLHQTQYSPPLPVISNQAAFTSPCHTHTLTYLTTRTSPSPYTYSLLRRASIRTISSELLPRGLSAGPLSFGDPVAGYTIAYVFRVHDPLARGSRRTHALLALAGKDANRAFRASPCVWRAFERIAGAIVDAAERVANAANATAAIEDDPSSPSPRSPTSEISITNSEQAGGRDRDVYARANNNNKARQPQHHRTFTPVSSFLSGRDVDPDGYPVRKPSFWARERQKSLAELVGNEYLFAELHAEFVALLQVLGRGFGGVPGGDDDGGASKEVGEDEGKDERDGDEDDNDDDDENDDDD